MSEDKMCGICSNDVLVNRRHVAKLQSENQQQAEQITAMNRKMADLRVNRGEKDEEIKRLKEFAVAVIRQECWGYDSFDGCEIQELSERLGLIEPHIATKADLDEYTDYDEGDTIYKFSSTLAAPPQKEE